MGQYVALLRGINVGGKNKVPMADLREAFEADGLTGARTYIASGNVLFETSGPPEQLERRIEALIERRFGLPIVVAVRSEAALRAVVESAPDGFGAKPDRFHSDVIFLRGPLTPARAMKVVRLRDGVDQAWKGRGVLYFARLSAQRTKSRMSSIVGTPEYADMTIRSWKTTVKLVELLDQA